MGNKSAKWKGRLSMSDLSKWLVEQETRFLPFFPTAGCLGAKEHVIALLILHAATCHEHFDKGPFFIEGLLGMYRVNGNSPFSLPVDGWGKIRRAQQQGMADELRIDICDRAYLADLVRPIPDETLVESLRELVKAAPVVDSLAASDAIAVWRGEGDIGQTEVPPLDESGVENLRIATRNADRGRSALAAFWAIAKVYTALSSSITEDIRTRSSNQLSLTDVLSRIIPVDLPNWILSRHLEVVERSLEDAYFARTRLYLACLEWYRLKKIHPKPMDPVVLAVKCCDATQSFIEA